MVPISPELGWEMGVEFPLTTLPRSRGHGTMKIKGNQWANLGYQLPYSPSDSGVEIGVAVSHRCVVLLVQ